jgi:hypothetical protein
MVTKSYFLTDGRSHFNRRPVGYFNGEVKRGERNSAPHRLVRATFKDQPALYFPRNVAYSPEKLLDFTTYQGHEPEAQAFSPECICIVDGAAGWD